MPSPDTTTTTSKSDALGVLSKGLSENSLGYRFPIDINDHYISFTAKNRGKSTKNTAPGSNPIATVVLPIPSNMSTGYGAQYDTGTGIGVLGDFARQISSGAQQFDTAQASQAAIEQAKAIGLSASPEVLALLGARVQGPLGAGVGAALGAVATGAAVGAGVAVNPHLAVIFSGVGFRTHNFQYKFSPRNRTESTNLVDIIKVFKKNMMPTIESAAFFKYPNEFDIDLQDKHKKYMFNFGTSVLTDFQVNYNPDGGSYFHADGDPVSVALSLTFTEIDILTQEKIEEGR